MVFCHINKTIFCIITSQTSCIMYPAEFWNPTYHMNWFVMGIWMKKLWRWSIWVIIRNHLISINNNRTRIWMVSIKCCLYETCCGCKIKNGHHKLKYKMAVFLAKLSFWQVCQSIRSHNPYILYPNKIAYCIQHSINMFSAYIAYNVLCVLFG